VLIPHPFDRFRPHSVIRHKALEELLPHIDIIEVFNSRTLLLRDSAKARTFAQSNGFLLLSAGSDAHTSIELGNAYVEMPEFDDVDSFRQALAQGQIIGRRTNPLVHISSLIKRQRSRLRKRG
jgi:predicted metal-dependent phosphoesterase TrpH